MNLPLGALGTGTLLQIAMVVVGHFVPSLQQMGLFPIAGTLIGLFTGWLAGGQRSSGVGRPGRWRGRRHRESRVDRARRCPVEQPRHRRWQHACHGGHRSAAAGQGTADQSVR
ncbi:MAG: hypothetical protein FJW27_09720 [Acidimicrobiia bacterium]|nr:hypothetical protein [Acidimicrobiia bacterium]